MLTKHFEHTVHFSNITLYSLLRKLSWNPSNPSINNAQNNTRKQVEITLDVRGNKANCTGKKSIVASPYTHHTAAKMGNQFSLLQIQILRHFLVQIFGVKWYIQRILCFVFTHTVLIHDSAEFTARIRRSHDDATSICTVRVVIQVKMAAHFYLQVVCEWSSSCRHSQVQKWTHFWYYRAN